MGITYTDSDLAAHDSNNFQVCDGRNPVQVANTVDRLGAPALSPAIGFGKVAAEVSNGEQDVAFETKASTREDGIVPVPAERAEGVLLHHHTNLTQLFPGLGIVDLVDKSNTLSNWKISPVDTFGGEGIFWVGKVAEDALFLFRGKAAVGRVAVDLIAGLWAVRHGNLTHDRVVMPLWLEVFRHRDASVYFSGTGKEVWEALLAII